MTLRVPPTTNVDHVATATTTVGRAGASRPKRQKAEDRDQQRPAEHSEDRPDGVDRTGRGSREPQRLEVGNAWRRPPTLVEVQEQRSESVSPHRRPDEDVANSLHVQPLPPAGILSRGVEESGEVRRGAPVFGNVPQASPSPPARGVPEFFSTRRLRASGGESHLPGGHRIAQVPRPPVTTSNGGLLSFAFGIGFVQR
jgi:hypothetical protein